MKSAAHLSASSAASATPRAEAVQAPAPAVETVDFGGRLEAAKQAAVQHLLGLQQNDGHWCAELEGDSILESEYAMLLWLLGRRDDDRIQQLARTLRSQQLESGGWAIYPGGPADLSPSVKAYFVLKLVGDDPDSEPMARAREAIRSLGGLARTNSFTKIYLAIFGQWPWSRVPAVPPELILTPRWFLLNIREMSAWSRAIVVPLAMIWALRPHCAVDVTLDELITGDSGERRGRTLRERFWFAFFRGVDRCIKGAERLRLFRWTRERALAECERWTLERLPKSAGLAAIVPAIANAVVALVHRGHDPEDGPAADQLEELAKLELRSEVDGQTHLRLQPCCSPVWDSALTLAALLDAGQDPASDAIQRGVHWLLGREVREVGDWRAKCPAAEPGGWYFEYANEFYPDCDDTAEVLVVLEHLQSMSPRPVEIDAAVGRGIQWLLAMQNDDGGWGAFDRGCDRELLTYVPFADHNAMIDPSTSDVTSRAVEAIAVNSGTEHRAVVRGAAFLRRMQEADGSWYGRWGCNYLYGTWLALCALSRVAPSPSGPDAAAVRRGVDWLLSVQLPCGGWGESLATYSDPSCKGQGPATAAQTAWALMGLCAPLRWNVDLDSDGRAERVVALQTAIRRGLEALIERQRDDGGWIDEHWTGTGFPEVFYLRYHSYDRYFPLQALAQAQTLMERGALTAG